MMITLFYDKLAAGETVLVPQSQETATVDINEVGDDFMMMHIKQRRQNEQEKTTGGETEVQKKVTRILEEEIEDYFKYIANMDYVELIKKFPSKLFNNKTFMVKQVTVKKDPIYTSSMFDVFGWWRDYGRNRFPRIELCALILFAKPIHNGFQERVFSRGTFTDDQLRRKMKESTFEIAILEAINCDVVDRYMESYKQRKTEASMSMNDRIDGFLKKNETLNKSIHSLSDDDSTESENEEGYEVEIDDGLDDSSVDEYILDECLQPTIVICDP
jgi:hypothetical protein